ncbi:hypothetical protein [Actibacterium mucosum]|uniref:hypothetical protein n=1 Tax=Actibacterium mucosum TaxID=1087332 RepID=UPI0012682FEF|nr:hypothetical protein [Actibacterium mucosum]
MTQPNLPLGPKTTMQFSWNAASLLLLSIAAGFALAALRGEVDTLVWFLTVLCGLHAVLGVVTTQRAQITTIGFPPTVLFAAIIVFGVLALTTA